MRRGGLMGMAALLLLPGAAPAERHVVSLAEARVIVSPQARGRVLLDFASLSALRDVVVTSAFLEVPLPSGAAEQEIHVFAYPLARSWRGEGATWTTPWTRPGGDLDETYFDEVTIPAGRRTEVLRLNVTQVVDEVLTEGAAFHGFVLTVPPSAGEGFTVTERARLGTMAGARLVVTTANARAAGDRRAG